MKTKRMFAVPLALSIGAFGAAGTLAQDTPTRVEGEVVRVMEQARVGEPDALDSIMIRTREGVRMRLLLGEPGSCQGCVQAGDQVRVRLMKRNASTEDGYLVRSMKVERSRQGVRFRNASGELVPIQTRDRIRSQEQIHRTGRGQAGTRGDRSSGGRPAGGAARGGGGGGR